MNEKLYNSMLSNRVDFMILCRPDNVAYTTGFDTPISYGATDNMANGPLSYAIIEAKTNKTTLFVADSLSLSAQETSFANQVLSFKTMDFFQDVGYPASLYAEMDKFLKDLLKDANQIAVEFLAAPWFISKTIQHRFSGSVIDAQAYLDRLRIIKQPYEIQIMREIAAALDGGHKELMRAAAEYSEGLSEYDVFFSIYKAVNSLSGKSVLTGDFATGSRIGQLSGVTGPKDRRIKRGDNGILDISLRLKGYWCDCANTVTFGASPSNMQQEIFKIVNEAYLKGLDTLKPGNTLRQVDEAMKSVFIKHGHMPVVYSGHQVGCNVNEPPRILCYDPETPVCENMVLCLEPQLFSGMQDGMGVRLEHLILVTKNGAEELNGFPWGYANI